MEIYVGDFEDTCTMVTVHGNREIDNTLHSQLTKIIRMGKSKIVLNLDGVKSWPPNTPFILMEIQAACQEQGGDLVLANLSWALDDEARRADEFRLLKIAPGLAAATQYFANR